MWMSITVGPIADAVPAAAPGTALLLVERLTKFFLDGGPMMFVNLLLLGLALAIAVERIAALLFRFNLDAPRFMEEVAKLVLTGNVDRAAKLCHAAPHSPLARVIGSGLARAHRGDLEVSKAMEREIAEQTPQVRARIGWLGSLAVIIALLGLIGTAFGGIDALRAAAGEPTELRSRLLMEGLGAALHNSAWALSIAALCAVLHFFLSACAQRLADQMKLSALELEKLLSRGRAPEASRALDLEKSA